jgi:hypothetical protein
MLLSFVVVVFWCIVYSILGVIVLACMPALRVTLLNLVAFVIGAFFGSLAFLYANGAVRLGRLEINPGYINLVGAVAGGILFVWLKMLFIRTPIDTRLL